MNNANENGERKVVTSLRDMPQSIAPPRDLWAGIEASIAADRQSKAGEPNLVELSAGSRDNSITSPFASRLRA